jgi:hypothetical protein
LQCRIYLPIRGTPSSTASLIFLYATVAPLRRKIDIILFPVTGFGAFVNLLTTDLIELPRRQLIRNDIPIISRITGFSDDIKKWMSELFLS